MQRTYDENTVIIFDTTLRDGEQSPGATLSSAEKLEIARQLSNLGVDVIEAGFPAASPDDLKAVEDESGIRPIIYTSYSMYRDKMRRKFDGYQFWIASYNPNESRVQDLEVIHWQYSDRGEVPGIKGLVDLNFSKQSFRPRIELAD